ncbi:MAG: AAA family ATPase [Hyphomicrobiaceae bacterium]
MKPERKNPEPEQSALDLDEWRRMAQDIELEVGRAIIGQSRVLRLMTIALFARGHVLLEGDVGVGKTTILRAFSHVIGGGFERVEGTIDLMPADMIYHTYLDQDGKPRVEPGPVLRHGSDIAVFFFNEINRARPQVHSLLLRLMAERTVTAFNKEHHFPNLQVFADRNRIEREETFELPAAARDRFFMEINVTTPSDRDVRRSLVFDKRFHDVDHLISQLQASIIDYSQLNAVANAIQANVTASDALERYVLDLWEAIRSPAASGILMDGIDTSRLVQAGASPRGLSFLLRAARVSAWLDHRDAVLPDDIRDIFFETMAHRIFLEPVYELRRETLLRQLGDAVFAAVPTPSGA